MGSGISLQTVPLKVRCVRGSRTGSKLSLLFPYVSLLDHAQVVVNVVPDPSDPLYEPPSNFVLGDPPTYKFITTNASFSGDITVCLSYLPSAFPAGTQPRLFHFVNEVWVDVTTRVDPVAQLVCGVVTSLSPFALGTVTSPTFLAQAYLKSLVQAPGRRFTLFLDLLFLERPLEDVVVSVSVHSIKGREGEGGDA
jgi:hypothetical protein